MGTPRRPPAVISIAGSDSGGGAGIQADLKAFARCGVHGMTAITAITAQNTQGVTRMEKVSGAMIVAQIKAVAEDIGIDAVKIGMLGDTETARAVLEGLKWVRPETPIVLDPVMVSESGSVLLSEDARLVLVSEIMPRVSVITPNLLEAITIAGAANGKSTENELSDEEVVKIAEAIRDMGAKAIIITGGHRETSSDILVTDGGATLISGERFDGGAAHGSGCTHSATLAGSLALGASLEDAAREAKKVASQAVRNGLRSIGEGPGPVDVFSSLAT